MNAPSRIWINVKGKEPPEWVQERMVSDQAVDGSFTIEATDEQTLVTPGMAIFEFADQVFACPPRLVQDRLKQAAGIVGDPEDVAPVPVKAVAKATRDLKLKPQIGTPPAPQFALIESLKVDDTYQRSIEGGASTRLIAKIAERWDWRLCLPLLVSRRDGQLFVIDGQHRLEAADLRGDIRQLPVVIFDFNSREEEAELFMAANRSRRPMSKLDDHHAAVVAGDKKAMAINEVVVAAGLRVGRNAAWQAWKPGEVVFVTAISRALHSTGREVVQQALKIVARAFPDLVLTGVSPVFTGLCTIIQQRAKQGVPINPDLMEMVLAEVGIPGWREVTERIEAGNDRGDLMLQALAKAYSEAEGE